MTIKKQNRFIKHVTNNIFSDNEFQLVEAIFNENDYYSVNHNES